jgi:hypothetical protein
MIARVKVAKQLIDAGLYDSKAAAGILMVIAGVIAEIAHKVSEKPELVTALPPSVRVALDWLLALAPVAELLIIVGGALASQGKPLLPPAPLTGAPSLLDDEREP